MIGMTLKVVEVATEVGDDEEVEAVHVVVAESGITRGANIPVDTETTITRMIITEIGVLAFSVRLIKRSLACVMSEDLSSVCLVVLGLSNTEVEKAASSVILIRTAPSL